MKYGVLLSFYVGSDNRSIINLLFGSEQERSEQVKEILAQTNRTSVMRVIAYYETSV